MHNPNFSPSVSIYSHVVLHCPLCYGVFHTHTQFINHVRIAHPLSSERKAILLSPVYASNIVLPGNPLLSQTVVPQPVSLQRNDRVVAQPTMSSYRNQSITRGRSPPIDRQQMETSISVGGSNSIIADSDEQSIADFTRPLINKLDVPIVSNVDELNIAKEQNDLDLNLRL
ncbi:hypothetical protein P3S67_001913 [Capsicum chacoense]